LLQALRHDEQLTEIELGPLDEAETVSLAANVASRELDPDLAACLYRETEGIPLFVVEIVRSGVPVGDQEPEPGEWETVCWPEPLPPRVKAAFTARLAQLSPPARQLAGVAATIGREFTFAVLAQVSDSDEDTLVRALDELWQRRIVREQGADAYDFSHDKLRQAAYASLSAARQRLLHRHVAQALEAVYAGDLDSVSGQVAAHYESAGQPAQAIPYYERAAEVARRIYANEEAIRYYQQALALLETAPPGESRGDWRQEMSTKLHDGLGNVLELNDWHDEARDDHQ
jgi:predicted ATPase